MFNVKVNTIEYKVYFSYDFDAGITTCHIQNTKDGGEFTGSSFCSTKDNFNKSIGRFISLLRASYAFNRKTRKLIMEEYKSKVKPIKLNFKFKV